MASKTTSVNTALCIRKMRDGRVYINKLYITHIIANCLICHTLQGLLLCSGFYNGPKIHFPSKPLYPGSS